MIRVAAYIDGFNLYYGLKDAYGRKFRWLNLQALSMGLLRPGQTLAQVTYFTARVRADVAGGQRQSDYLDALDYHCSLVRVVDGRFQQKSRRCSQCGAGWTVYEEKETDVSIAVALVEDAVRDRYDTALLISGDSDLCPAVRSAKRLRPDKRIIAVFPPKRRSDSLRAVVDGFLILGEDKIRRAQLPPDTVTPGGLTLQRPKYWS